MIDFNGRIFGKPAGIESAQRMLHALAGRQHRVITGFCLSGPPPDLQAADILFAASSVSAVRFRSLSAGEISAYLAAGEWAGKAGAYAIQETGFRLVEELTGDFDNVVGLPTSLIYESLHKYFSHCRFL